MKTKLDLDVVIFLGVTAVYYSPASYMTASGAIHWAGQVVGRIRSVFGGVLLRSAPFCGLALVRTLLVTRNANSEAEERTAGSVGNSQARLSDALAEWDGQYRGCFGPVA